MTSKKVLLVKALESTPWSTYLKWYLQGEVRLCSAAILKFATRRAGLGVLDSTIPLLSKASMRVPLSSWQGCTTFFASGGGGYTTKFFTHGQAAPQAEYKPFFKEKVPLLWGPLTSREGGGGGYACPLFWISNSVVLPFWDWRSLFHLALCGCFKVMSLSECYQPGRASLVYLLLTNGTPLTPPSERSVHPF